MHFDRTAYGERIKRLRTGRELTQEQLAEKINVSRTYIVKIENGLQIPQQLLEQAGIDSNAEVQIACMDGAIIITGDTPLTEDELSEVIGRLRAVNDLTEHFPSELDTEEGGGTGYGRF